MLSQTADRGKGKKSVKEVLLKVCLVKNMFLRRFQFLTILGCCLYLKIYNYRATNKEILEKLSLSLVCDLSMSIDFLFSLTRSVTID